MGWKCDTLLIRPAIVEEGPEKLLRDLGFRLSAPIGERPYAGAIWPERGTIWVGRAGDCLVLSSRGLAEPFFKDDRSDFMTALFRRFPNSEVAALLLHSVVNLWGFAVYSNGELLRRKAGASDDGTYLDWGAPLPEEEELLAKSTLDAEGRRVYRLPEWPDEDFSEDGVGEEFVFGIYERLIGARPDKAFVFGVYDPIGAGSDATGAVDLLELPCAGFALRPWWKFW